MKRGIAFQLALLLAVFGVLSSSLAGYASYVKSRAALIQAAEDEMTAATRVFGRRITVAIGEIARDARLLARHPDTRTVLANNQGAAAAEDRMAELLAAILGVHKEYFQIRLIDADQYGIERVRVDRLINNDLPLHRVRGDGLQEKAHQPYVFRTLKLERDAVYVSRIVINHEQGTHAGLDQPSIQIATPVIGDAPEPLGVVVINVDLNSLFNLMKTDLSPGTSIYLANKWGDFLLHPAPEKAFAFDQGRRELVQDAFPSTAALVEGRADKVIVNGEAGGPLPVVASFLRIDLDQNDGDRFLLLGLSKPLSEITARADALAAITLAIVIAASGLAFLTAIVVARSLTGPLSQMAKAVRHFAPDQTVAPLPTGRHDELGMLARSFNEMQDRISTQMKTLHERQLELDHLARHDPLTGLANRKLFFERLDQTLARSRRNGLAFALFYIDLDRFKEVNDKLGHAAGDTVLKVASERLLATLREVDLVARLGGDEFIVLIEGTDDRQQLALIARKMLEVLVSPIDCGGHAVNVEASIGISIFPQHGGSAADLITSADDAMYQAKSGGRNNFFFCEYPPASSIGAPADKTSG